MAEAATTIEQPYPLMQRLEQTFWPIEDADPWIIWRYSDQPEVHAPPVKVTSARLTWAIVDHNTPAYLDRLVVVIEDPLTSERREIPCGLGLGQRKPPSWVAALVEGVNRLTLDVAAVVNR